MHARLRVLFVGLAALCLAIGAGAQRTRYLMDDGWKFQMADPFPKCKDVNGTFPEVKDNIQCMGLTQAAANTLDECISVCCANADCQVYQFCEGGDCGTRNQCWIGKVDSCHPQNGWVSRARSQSPPPSPSSCTDDWCDPSTDDSSWRGLDLPHDFVVEGTFTESADKAHGYLPFGVGLYRKHFTLATALQTDHTIWIDFDGIQSSSEVFLNGQLLGTHKSGYTPSRYFLNASVLKFGDQPNVLAVKADATSPDGWWYDGGGIYRHVWLTAIATPGPHIAPWGIYAPSQVAGPISWSAQGVPSADAQVTPSVEIWNSLSSPASVSLALTVRSVGSSTPLARATGSITVPPKTSAIWNASSPLSLTAATLWHLVKLPATPALYLLEVTLSYGGNVVDTEIVRFGVRNATFDAATGFYLNGINTKILGTANHQDFAGLGVAIPDHLQAHRILKLKEMGVNGWRTAHNPPNIALLDAADEIGMVVWDENHRNGQDAECELLIKRDRNHPSVVIWSLCNEVLCNTNDWVNDALRLKALIRRLDPRGARPVSANQNGWIGPHTPLDLQGFDYSTGSYDGWHRAAPNIPSISSETSSAVSDRGEYVNNETAGYVSGYDNNYPGWGESAEQAWGGIGVGGGQGILTRPFISGGWTWTGWDYKGEPTPYAWPDINSHFGILDIAGFPKDRFFWYRAWFVPDTPSSWLFPHWSWDNQNFNLPIWVYSNGDEVELFVNGKSQGRKAMPKYGHVEWTGVKYEPGSLKAVSYKRGVVSSVVYRNTTSAPAALRLSIKDGVGASLAAGCKDVALLQVEVVDQNGAVVPDASNEVTFSVTGSGALVGTGNGDPACHVSDKSATRPAYHGYVLGVVRAGNTAGTITVSATAPGLRAATPVTLTVGPHPTAWSYWCHVGASL